MKYFAFAALVSAHKHHHHHKEFEAVQLSKKCPVSDKKAYTDVESVKLFGSAYWGGFLKGLYQTDNNVLGEKCFGSWMEEPMK